MLPTVTNPNVLVGTTSADDAAVYRLNDELALIQTIDFFTPIVDDPYMFGAIAAANSLSDVYAMGGRPIMALNVVAFPKNNEAAPMSVLREILRGGADKAREAGIDIIGGHTVDDEVPKYGLSVSGVVHPDAIWRNDGGAPGDRLVLTKPLGMGILSSAMRAGDLSEARTSAAVEVMAGLNRGAAEVALEVGVRACTDITGFGLLGHLREMVGGRLGARINASAVPRMDGTREFAEAGKVPGGSRRNQTSLADVVEFSDAVDEAERLILCDAQSSGGLLFAVAPNKVNALVEALEATGTACAADIGELVETPVGTIHVS